MDEPISVLLLMPVLVAGLWLVDLIPQMQLDSIRVANAAQAAAYEAGKRLVLPSEDPSCLPGDTDCRDRHAALVTRQEANARQAGRLAAEGKMRFSCREPVTVVFSPAQMTGGPQIAASVTCGNITRLAVADTG